MMLMFTLEVLERQTVGDESDVADTALPTPWSRLRSENMIFKTVKINRVSAGLLAVHAILEQRST